MGSRALAAKLVEEALESDVGVVMIPLQDLLGLGDKARMNVPGVADGNWRWQAHEDDVADCEQRIAELMKASGRFA